MQQLNADFSIHDLLRRNREIPRHQPLKGITVIAPRDKIIDTNKMGVVTDVLDSLFQKDIHFLRDLFDAELT